MDKIVFRKFMANMAALATSKKFSEFDVGGDIQRGDVVVGLRAGENIQFDFPGLGIKDANGNYMLQYDTAGASAVNYPLLTNALTGSPVIYGTGGTDAERPIWIRPGGSAGVKIDDLNWPLSDGVAGSVITTDGLGNLSFTGSAAVSGITGTANQVLANGTSGSAQTGNVTLTTPQDIGTTSSPTFANLTLTNPLTLANGGTSKALTASNGGIVYTDADSMEVLAGTATARQMLQSGASTTPAWSTATWPATTAINQILYSSAANVVAGLPTANSAILYTNSTGIPAFSASMTNGQIMIGATGASPIPSTITDGPGITVTNGANTITVSQSPGGMTWTEVLGTSQLMAPDNGYIVNNAALVTLTLPAVMAQGSFIKIAGKGAGGWVIAQNAGQNIQCGNLSSSVGVGGTVASTNRYDSAEWICTTADTTLTLLGAPQSAGLSIV